MITTKLAISEESSSAGRNLTHRAQDARDASGRAPLKVLLCHNFYQQSGGEDQVFADETWLLESQGHEVVRYTRHNDDIDKMNRWQAARRTLWNQQTYVQLQQLIRRRRPDIVHFTNTFPLISPAAFYAARSQRIAVVQSLHNYRLLCPSATFLRQGQVCEDCLGKSTAWPGVLHGCYRKNRAATAVVAAMQTIHGMARTWHRAIDRYIALTEFSREKLIEGGLPADKILVKPNFVHPDPGVGEGRGGYAAFVGRLAPEKGIEALLEAWDQLPDPIPLKIIGGGPLSDLVQSAAQRNRYIQWLGQMTLNEVLSVVGDAFCLVMPSIWYEVCPKTILESFAKGTPVIASRLGGMAELVDHGRNGLHFTAGNSADLADKVQQLWADDGRCAQMRKAARETYLARYTADSNYQQLVSIYRQAMSGDVPKEAS